MVKVKVQGNIYEMNKTTYSKIERTILDWDSDYISEFLGDDEMKINGNEPTRLPTVGSVLRVNEYGNIVHPPSEPEKPKTENWKRMTPKRREILHQYKMDKEEYDIAMAEWMQLPLLDEGRSHEEHIDDLIHALRTKPTFHGITYRKYYDYLNGVFDPQPVVLTYWVKKFGEVRFCSRAVTHTELEVVECDPANNYWTQQGFEGNASQERRRYKRNRDLDMDTEYDTDIESGERRQQTLFNCRTSDKGSRIVDYEYIHRFEAKPNVFLSKMYLDYILNGVPINDWYKAQINKWIKNARVGGYQSTL
jgi:hypothetical protein